MKTSKLSSILAAVLLVSLLAGCANQDVQKAATNLGSAVVAYSQGNDVDTVVDSLSAASYLLRSLQSTPQADSSAATQSAVASAGAPSIAPQVAAAIASLTAKGVAPDNANETVASVLDVAVAARQANPIPATATTACRGGFPRRIGIDFSYPKIQPPPFSLRHRNPFPKEEDEQKPARLLFATAPQPFVITP